MKSFILYHLHTSTRKEGKCRDSLRKGNKEETRRGREHRTKEGKKGQRDGNKTLKKGKRGNRSSSRQKKAALGYKEKLNSCGFFGEE